MLSENGNTLIKIEVPESVDNAISNLTNKPTEAIGTILSDCLFLVFGWAHQKIELRRAKYAHDLKEFTEELEKKINEIPVEDRVLPDTHTVCSALENMRYCVEEPELRKMFSTLIANSINSKATRRVHPAYGEIIKQLTAQDALLVARLAKQEVLPVIRLRIAIKKTDSFMFLPELFLQDQFQDIDTLPISIENLIRLKIVNLDFDHEIVDERAYNDVRDTKAYRDCKSAHEANIEADREIVDERGVIEVTHFGKRFIESCC